MNPDGNKGVGEVFAIAEFVAARRDVVMWWNKQGPVLQGLQVTTMKRISSLLVMLMIAAVLIAQTGCALLTTRRVAMAAGKVVGKKVYENVKDDKAKNEQPKQE